MPARLTLYPPDQPVQRFLLDPRREYLVGRGPDCDLRVADSRLSRRHARLACSSDRWLLSDLESKNGVQLDGRAVHETALADGNWISFGGLLCNFDVVSEERLAAERDRAQSRWQTTINFSRRLDPHADIDALLRQLLDSALELADAERAFVMLVDEQGRLAVRARVSRLGALAAEARFPGSTGTVRRVLAERRSVVVCDARADALLAARPSIASEEIRALVCLPLAIGDHPAGVMYLDSCTPGKVFTQLDVDLLEAFAEHAALVIGVASIRTELVDLAALLPAEMSRHASPVELVRRLQAALPRYTALVAPDGNPA